MLCMLGGFFGLMQLAIDLGAHSAVRGDGQRIQPCKERNGLASLCVGVCLSFGWTATPL
jgi:hypothetical protein